MSFTEIIELVLVVVSLVSLTFLADALPSASALCQYVYDWEHRGLTKSDYDEVCSCLSRAIFSSLVCIICFCLLSYGVFRD